MPKAKILKFPVKKEKLKITKVGEVRIREDETILIRGFTFSDKATVEASKILALEWALDVLIRAIPIVKD